MPKIWPWDHALPDSSMNSATAWILLVDYWDCQVWRDLIPCRGLCAKKTFFSSSVLEVLEYDLIFVRLILDCCALDYVICQDVLLKEKQALGTASHITQFSRRIPNTCTDFVSSEGDKKKWYFPLLCPVWSVRADRFAADWFSMARLQMTSAWGNRRGGKFPQEKVLQEGGLVDAGLLCMWPFRAAGILLLLMTPSAPTTLIRYICIFECCILFSQQGRPERHMSWSHLLSNVWQHLAVLGLRKGWRISTFGGHFPNLPQPLSTSWPRKLQWKLNTKR